MTWIPAKHLHFLESDRVCYSFDRAWVPRTRLLIPISIVSAKKAWSRRALENRFTKSGKESGIACFISQVRRKRFFAGVPEKTPARRFYVSRRVVSWASDVLLGVYCGRRIRWSYLQAGSQIPRRSGVPGQSKLFWGNVWWKGNVSLDFQRAIIFLSCYLQCGSILPNNVQCGDVFHWWYFQREGIFRQHLQRQRYFLWCNLRSWGRLQRSQLRSRGRLRFCYF